MTTERRALAGGLVCVGYIAATVPRPYDAAWAHLLLVFAALVLVPLVLDLLIERNDARAAVRWLGWVQSGQFPAAALLAFACYLRPGAVAALLTLPWLGMTALLAAVAVVRVQRHGVARPLDRLSTDAGLVFAVIGGLWAVADRAGYGPLRFDAQIVALTAVHFHYAGFVLPVFTGLVARRLPDSRFVARVAVAIVLGVPAVAVGIIATHLGWRPSIEAAAGTVLAVAGLCVAVFHLQVAADKMLPTAARVYLGIAGASLLAGMVLAALYAMRVFVPIAELGWPQMRAFHGTVNALGFGLCGALGWRIAMNANRAASLPRA